MRLFNWPKRSKDEDQVSESAVEHADIAQPGTGSMEVLVKRFMKKTATKPSPSQKELNEAADLVRRMKTIHVESRDQAAEVIKLCQRVDRLCGMPHIGVGEPNEKTASVSLMRRRARLIVNYANAILLMRKRIGCDTFEFVPVGHSTAELEHFVACFDRLVKDLHSGPVSIDETIVSGETIAHADPEQA